MGDPRGLRVIDADFPLEDFIDDDLEVGASVAFDERAVEQQAASAGRYIPQVCYRCGTDEDHAPLLPVRDAGTSAWVCTHCLPALIHG